MALLFIYGHARLASQNDLSTALLLCPLQADAYLPAGERPTLKDWETHLTTIFPEVRLKRYMEMRGGDGGPLHMIVALSAFWIGLLYSP